MKRGWIFCICFICLLQGFLCFFDLAAYLDVRATHDDVEHQRSTTPGPTVGGLPAPRCNHLAHDALGGEAAGNGRAILALLITSLKYIGVNRLKETLPTWEKYFFPTQGNVDMVLFYSYPVLTAAQLIKTFELRKADESQLSSLELRFRNLRDDVLSDVSVALEEWALLNDGYFYLSEADSPFVFRLVPINLTFPRYIQRNWSLLENPTWMRCGCPPFCPVRRTSSEYIQGTRWYSYDLFKHPIVQRYSFWVKMDVDVAFFKALNTNLVQLLVSSGRPLAHTGYTYNGRGCSDELQDAIQRFLVQYKMRAVSEGQAWWLSDDRTYYTNFVMGSVNFFLHPSVQELMAYLNEYPDGFFKHRWTDQSLLHKVMGVFCGPQESDFVLNWENLRCTKKKTTPDAVFYHSKRHINVRPGRPCKH